MIIFSLWYFKKLGISIENMISKRKQLLNATINNINNFKFIRMFNKQKDEKQNYKILNGDCCNEEVKFIKLVLFYDIILEHLTYLKTPIIYMLGGIAIIKRKDDNGISSCIE
jgi:ABC-type multidrug transport system fused ATPase/permease subunit